MLLNTWLMPPASEVMPCGCTERNQCNNQSIFNEILTVFLQHQGLQFVNQLQQWKARGATSTGDLGSIRPLLGALVISPDSVQASLPGRRKGAEPLTCRSSCRS